MKLKNVRVVTLNDVLEHHTIEVENGFIKSIKPTQINEGGLDGQGLYVLPGFIDTHIHGAAGADVMDATPEALETISQAILQEGTTRFCPTTMTMDTTSIVHALKNAAKTRVTGAQIEGIHLEGPFISKAYPGAQNPIYIEKGKPETLDVFVSASNHTIRLMTFAPEEHDAAFIRHAQSQGIVCSIGHSNATEEHVALAHALGVKQRTHFYNAMRPLHHRDCGVVGMSLLQDDAVCEVIADRVHTSDYALKLLAKLKPQHINLITDSISAKYLDDGRYSLGGLEIVVKNGIARTLSGALAGSTLRMDQALKNMHILAGWSLNECAYAASTRPALTLGKGDTLGQLAPGYHADMVLLDDDLKVVKVYVAGELKYTHPNT